MASSTDPNVQELIQAAVRRRESGDMDGAREDLAALWPEVEHGDPFDRLFFAHSYADVQESAEDEVRWDLIALETQPTVRPPDRAEGLLPSLHLNLAEDYRKLGDETRAAEHYRAGLEHLGDLDDDPYGRKIREAFADFSHRPLVLHLNGAPGVGKSTLARRWADAHPGTLLLDPDVLRTWVSGWRADFAETGAAIRPVAIAMLAAYVAQGRDVVLGQLLADPDELERFRSAAAAAGGRWVEVLVEADEVAARFAGRKVDQPHLEEVHKRVADAGPDHLTGYGAQLEALVEAMPDAIRLPTRDGEIDAAYDTLSEAVATACD